MHDHKKTKRDPLSFDSFQVVEVKAVVGGSSSEMSGPSSSSGILRENRPNGLQNPSNVSAVLTAIQKQGERMDRALGVFEHQSDSIKTQVAMLTVQGSVLKQHSDALGTIMKDHQKLQKDVAHVQTEVAHVQTEVARHGSVLKQYGTKLEMMEGRMDKLCKGRRRDHSKLRRSTRIEASRTPRARRATGKYHQVQCSFCDKTLSSSYIRQHKSKCPAQRPKPQESQ